MKFCVFMKERKHWWIYNMIDRKNGLCVCVHSTFNLDESKLETRSHNHSCHLLSYLFFKKGKNADCMNIFCLFVFSMFNHWNKMGNILLGDVYFIKYIFRLADEHMLSKVVFKYVIKVSTNLHVWTLKKTLGNSPFQTESCCFPLISFVSLEMDWLKTFDKRRDGWQPLAILSTGERYNLFSMSWLSTRA